MASLLIIDDELELRDVLRALLEDVASEIITCTNGLEACEMLETRTFDAILSDEKMPKRSGMEVLRWIRSKNIQTPFILHTGFGNNEMLVEAKSLGIYAFIDKPWSEAVLIQTVQEALKQS